jgi:hypothetical protein
MTEENLRMMILDYYGRGKASALAEAVKAALNSQALVTNN